MAEKRKPSGSEFRKRRHLVEAKKAKLPKITSFFSKATTSSVREGCEDIGEDERIEEGESSSSGSLGTSEELSEKLSEQPSTSGLGELVTIEDSPIINSATSLKCEVFSEISDEIKEDIQNHPLLGKLVTERNPTDKAHYGLTIEDSDIKKFVIKYGSCRPRGPFPKKQFADGRRSFSEHYYTFRNKSGLELSRFWLCYSPILDSCYCEPCWLFANRSNKNFNVSWISGISDWQGLSKKLQVHEASEQHLNACTTYEIWKAGKQIDEKMESELRKERNFWRSVLHRILNVILTLATNNIPLRGHRELIEAGKVEGGNFLAIIQLLSEYDPVLKELINKTSKVKYLSPKIQNELIELLSQAVLTQILNNIKNSPFFSIILDTTQDISKIDQLSVIIRYVSIDKDDTNRPIKVNINESFLGFHSLLDQSAAGFQDFILNFLKSKNINISKCRGQGYDGASVMSGRYTGLQARISAIEKNATYIHCAAHNLNLVINDAVSGVIEVTSFFDIIQNVYMFFSNSINRWNLLKSPESEISLTLKKLCSTRWSSRNDSLNALRYRYSDVFKSLTEISLKSKKNDEKTTALGLLKNISRFEFIALIVIFEKVLNLVNIVSKYLQSINADIGEAILHLENAQEQINGMRNSFEETIDTAKSIANKWAIKTEFQTKRNKRVKKFFDDLAEDTRFEDAAKKFQVEIFNKVLDIIIFQINSRFESFKQVVNSFKVLTAPFLMEASDDELYIEARRLSEKYDEDLTDMFPSQMISFRNCIRNRLRPNLNVKELTTLVFCDNYVLSSSFSEVCSAYILYLTLPVTVASAERTFSKLKLIKTYLRSTMSELRLSGLAVLNIEREITKSMDFEELIDQFASVKARRQL